MSSSKLKSFFVTFGIIVAATVIAFLLNFFFGEGKGLNPVQSSQSETIIPGKIEKGRLPGYENAEINEDPQYFCYLISSSVEFDNYSAPGRLMLENTQGNNCDMEIIITLDDGETEIYRSAVIHPGEYMVWDVLEKKLDIGSYNCIATINALDIETGEVKGIFTDNVKIKINNKPF